MKRFLLGTLATLGVLLFAFVFEGGNPLNFILPSPLIITFGMPFFAVLAVWDFKTWGRAWADAFAAQTDPARRQASERLWEFWEKLCYLAGIVGFIAGLTIIFASAKPDWSIQDFGKYFSVGLISPLLGLCFAIVGRILRYRVTTRGN